MENWNEIHSYFTEALQREWEYRKFNYEQCQKWIKLDLNPNEFAFVAYLESKGCNPQQENLNLDEWRIKWKESSKNSQEWLDKNYPKENRGKVSEINLNEPTLEGELDLTDFTREWGIGIYVYPQVDENKLVFKNLPERARINLKNVQKYVNYDYPTKQAREQVTNLRIYRSSLEGELDLTDFSNLEILDCSENKLTSLDLTNCPNLKELYCGYNQLSHLDLSQNIKLEKLSIGNNDFPERSPDWLSHLVNLKMLRLGHNKFAGSLEFTKNMSRLEKLDIYGTNLTGLEYLPLNLKKFQNVLSSREYLEFYDYNLFLWQQFHHELVKKAGKEIKIVDYTGIEPQKITTIPKSLYNIEQEELYRNVTLSVNYNPTLNYSDFLLRDPRPFTWETPFAETLEFWQENLSGLIENFSFDKFQGWKDQLGFNTINKFKSLFLSVENKEKFWEENEVKSFEELVANSSPKEVITRISKFSYVQSSGKSEKEERIKQHYKLAEDQSLTEEQIDNYLYQRAIGEIVDLPTRLYNIEKGKNKLDVRSRKELNEDVELTISKAGETFPVNDQIKRYATMSYVCGKLKEEGEIYTNARKALNKVIKALELINRDKSESEKINHVWIDQLSIVQDGEEGKIDKGIEIPKMKQYYNDSKLTLIAIDSEIGNEVNKENENFEYLLTRHILIKIVASPWFNRSWTFQEGLLTKQTIFMFDDYIVDGRILALRWSGLQKTNSGPDGMELNTTSQIFITPLGWSYGAQENQEVNLTLGEALLSVKHREQTVSVDGIYALLGLFPYGKKVNVNYKPFGYKYTEEELGDALYEVVKEAVKQDHGKEIFSWLGFRNKDYWYLPQFRASKNYWFLPCLTQVNGSTEVEELNDYYQLLKDMQISLQGIQLESEVFRIDEIILREGHEFIIKSKENLFSLKRSPEILKQMQVGDVLVVISESKKGADRHLGVNYSYLAILMPSNANYAISLVEIKFYGEKKPIPQRIFADLVNKRIIFAKENINYYQELVEELDAENHTHFSFFFKKNRKQELMNNFLEWSKWKLIHPSFTEELVKKWKERDFSYEQVCEWSSAFAKDFNPSEIDFYLWLRDSKKIASRKCKDEHNNEDGIERSKLRNQLIIDYFYPNEFKQTELYGNSNKRGKSLNDLIAIGRVLNWTKIETILIREIKVNYDNNVVNGIQCIYQVKSKGDWKLVEGEKYGEIYGDETETIKLVKGEHLTKLEWWISGGLIKSLSFHTINSVGEKKVYGSYGKDEGENFSLTIDNNKKANVFYGNNANIYGNLLSLGIQQTPHQITQEDWKLIAQIEVPTSNQNK